MAIEYDDTVVVSQPLHVYVILLSSNIVHAFVIDDLEKHLHLATCKVLASIAGRPDQNAAVSFIPVAQKVISIHDLVHSSVNFYLEMVVNIQQVNLSVYSNVISTYLWLSKDPRAETFILEKIMAEQG